MESENSNELTQNSSNPDNGDFISINVFFKIHYAAKFGESVYICGSPEGLGSWDPVKAIKMQWNQDHYWSCFIQFNRYEDIDIEYKYLINDSDKPRNWDLCWEPGPNRIISQYCLKNTSSDDFFVQEIWGYREVILQLNYNLESSEQSMYIIGDLPCLGSSVTPIKMKHTLQKDLINGEIVQQWYIKIVVNPNQFNIRYQYVIKQEKENVMVWERLQGRVFTSSCIKYLKNQQLEQKSQEILFSHRCSHRNSSCKNNGSFQTIDVSSPKRKQMTIKNNKGYGYQNIKGIPFFFQEKFGCYVKLDLKLLLDFQFDIVNENILLGPYPQFSSDVDKLYSYGVKAVLNLQTKFDFQFRGINMKEILNRYEKYNIHMINYPILDMDPSDLVKKGGRAAQILKKLVNKYEKVYVHCSAGIWRAPSVVVLYLANILNYELIDAIYKVKQKRQNFYVKGKVLKKASENYNGSLLYMKQAHYQK